MTITDQHTLPAILSAAIGVAGAKLNLLAERIGREFPNNRAAARTALLEEIAGDAELLYEFCRPFMNRRADELLLAAWGRNRAADAGRARERGPVIRETQVPRAPLAKNGATLDHKTAETQTLYVERRADRDDQVFHVTHDHVVVPVTPVPAPPRPHAAGNVAMASLFEHKLLDRLINGRRLRELTVREARGWAKSHRRQAREVELLCFGLDDDFIIGDHVDAATADKCIALAAMLGNEA